jgi:membrane protein
MTYRELWSFFKEIYDEWAQDDVVQIAAALAYYAAFAIAPLLVIAIVIAGLVFGQEAVEGQLVDQLGGFVGDSSARVIQRMIASAYQTSAGIVATVIGIGTLLFASSRLFFQLKKGLNDMWGADTYIEQGIWRQIKQRFFSVVMVLGTGFLLLVSLIVSSLITAAVSYFRNLVEGLDFLWQVINFATGLSVTTLIFAMIYRYVPDVRVAWKDVITGSLFTALLFTIGQFLLGIYLARGTFSSTYGAAGSFLVILLWVYCSAQILLLGAEFTQVYARRYGSRIRPPKDAQSDP